MTRHSKGACHRMLGVLTGKRQAPSRVDRRRAPEPGSVGGSELDRRSAVEATASPPAVTVAKMATDRTTPSGSVPRSSPVNAEAMPSVACRTDRNRVPSRRPASTLPDERVAEPDDQRPAGDDAERGETDGIRRPADQAGHSESRLVWTESGPRPPSKRPVTMIGGTMSRDVRAAATKPWRAPSASAGRASRAGRPGSRPRSPSRWRRCPRSAPRAGTRFGSPARPGSRRHPGGHHRSGRGCRARSAGRRGGRSGSSGGGRPGPAA